MRPTSASKLMQKCNCKGGVATKAVTLQTRGAKSPSCFVSACKFDNMAEVFRLHFYTMEANVSMSSIFLDRHRRSYSLLLLLFFSLWSKTRPSAHAGHDYQGCREIQVSHRCIACCVNRQSEVERNELHTCFVFPPFMTSCGSSWIAL